MDYDDKDLTSVVDGPESGYDSEASSFYEGDISLIEQYEDEGSGKRIFSIIYAVNLVCLPGGVPNTPPHSDSEVSETSGKRKGGSDSGDSYDASDVPGPSKRIRPSEEDPESPPHPEDIHIIAHSPVIASLIEKIGVSHGVRYELARLISAGKLHYRKITEDKLLQLRGPNQDAVPKIAEVFFGEKSSRYTDFDSAFANEIAAHSPWAELDKEEEAHSFGPYEGLGNNPRYPGWYGGKVRFSARLQLNSKKGDKQVKNTFKIILDDCALGTSFRHARRWGSWSFLRVKVPAQAFYDTKIGLDLFFRKKFVIWGYVFRACYAMGDNVFFYWTNDLCGIPRTIPGRLSLEEFIQWHNPLASNSNQLMTKWSERMRLGFSNSIPGPHLDARHSILEEPDIVSEKGSVMTDGCGFSTRILHLLIRDQLSLSLLPTAFQFRLAGYKGMSMLRDDPEYVEGKRVWVRPSQTKIKYPTGVTLDPSMLTIDLLRTSHMSTECSISNDILINLAENGVPHDVFIEMLKTSVRGLVAGLTTWDGPLAMLNLWTNVERAGGVLAGRRAREAVGEARVRGYRNRSPEEDELNDDDDADEDGFSENVGDTIMMLLEAGFTPQETPILREKLKQSVVKKIENRMKNLRFRVEESCTAFAIPDPFGVLGHNEIQIKSSSRNLKGTDGMITDTILGDVLNPCKGHVMFARAVEHHLLRNYTDVIVFSIKGDRRLIDWLGGGDYDGDVATAIWTLALVLLFLNADEALSEEPAGLDLCFKRDAEKVSDFIERTRTLHLKNLGAKFCRVLDAPKTGYRIKKETLAADTKMYSNSLGPRWKAEMKKKIGKTNESNMTYTRRDVAKLGPFIMDVLRHAADKEKDGLLTEMDIKFAPLRIALDPVLVAPWEAAEAWAERGSNAELTRMKRYDLSIIAKHVQNIFNKHKEVISVNTRKKDSAGFTNLPIEARQDRLRAISKEFYSGPQLSQLQLVPDEATLARWRASYAYKFDAEQHMRKTGWSRFPWNVAMRDLCLIKASASPGQYTPMIDEFAQRMKLPKRL
ncbi:RNA dependent RNA polymerase-domain-containing protein [Gymnopilus junonius]|uniref:RNA-dependent RNA polymerase n=1 Tax=Gymnopilus junonius TaxID=109634 RepID=A0A9P5NX67_GYMJU|nr:RNA dependent RNA polymerase-domain-containing protein [Gymnopilus junonius]